MNRKKMMLVSVVATICLSILAVVTMMLVSQFQNGDVKKAVESLKKKQTEEPVAAESPVEEVEEFQSKGIRYYTDDLGTHDVYFEEDTSANNYEAATGPIAIKIKKLQMERFYPESNQGKVLAEGNDEMTLVAVELELSNTSNKMAYLDIQTVDGKADSGEISHIEEVLSDEFQYNFEANSTQAGTIYFMYKEKPDKLATVTLRFTSAEDENFKAIDKGTEIKIELF